MKNKDLKIERDQAIEKDLMSSLSKGVMPSLTITYPGVGQFKLRFPTSNDELAQARIVSKYLGGLPRESFDKLIVSALEMNALLIVAIEEYPDDFPEIWKREGFIDYPKAEVKNALNKAFLEFRKEIEKKISEL